MKPIHKKSRITTEYFVDSIVLIYNDNEQLILDIHTVMGQFKIEQNIEIIYSEKIRVFEHRIIKWIIYPILAVKDEEGRWINKWNSKHQQIDTLNIRYKGNKWINEDDY